MLLYLPDQNLRIQRLIQFFNSLFQTTENTVLVAGGEEPIYLPKNVEYSFHRIIFRKDYFASALHEIAHWCIAGKQRRQLVDYGYWYQPDGRNEAEQRLFEEVEVKPQALEWILSQAAGLRFRISTDNLKGQCGDLTQFKRNVVVQAHHYLEQGLPQRALLLAQTLAVYSRREHFLSSRFFQLEAL